MFNKTFMKLFAVVMVLAVMFQLAMPASAYNQTSSGYQYSGTITSSGTTNFFSMHNATDYVDHVGGTTSTIRATVRSSHQKTASNPLGDYYSGKISYVLSSYNYADIVARTIYVGDSVTVPPTATSGRYIMAVRFPGGNITVTVKKYAVDADGNLYLVMTDTSLKSSYTPVIGATVLAYYAY